VQEAVRGRSPRLLRGRPLRRCGPVLKGEKGPVVKTRGKGFAGTKDGGRGRS